MGRMFAMGVSASNCSTDLADKAKAHAAAREGMIQREVEDYAQRTGKSMTEANQYVREVIAASRKRIRLAGGEQTPNMAEHGVGNPVVVHGEVYQTNYVEYENSDRSGDRILHVARPLGGGRFAERKIRLCVDGGDRTRVVASAKGG